MSLTSENRIIIRGIPSMDSPRPVDTGHARAIVNNVNACCDGAARVVCAQAQQGGAFFSSNVSTTDTTPVGPIVAIPYHARVRHDGAAYPVRVRIAASIASGSTLTLRAVIGDPESLLDARTLSAPVPQRSLDIVYASSTPGYGSQSDSMVRLTPSQTDRCRVRVPSRSSPTGPFGEADAVQVWLAVFAWASPSGVAQIHGVYAAEFVGDP